MFLEGKLLSLNQTFQSISPVDTAISLEQTYYDQDIGRNARSTYRLHYGNHSFRLMFYSPNEIPLPLPPTGFTLLIGQKPVNRKDGEWNRFLNSAGNKSKFLWLNSDTQRMDPVKGILLHDPLLIVESNPASIIQAAQVLQPSNEILSKLVQTTKLDQARNGRFISEFIDYVLAGKFIDGNGNLKKVPDYEGELLMLQSLLGNKETALELSRRTQTLRDIDKVKFGSQEPYLLDHFKQGLNVDDLVAVHVTNYFPQVDEAGAVFIMPRFDGSGFSEARSTIHFALNHHVVPHSGGFMAAGTLWEKMPYVILSPFKGLIELNGFPVSMRAEDTYFATSPGEPLVLPENTTIVLPREERKQGGRAKIVPYAGSTFTTDELTTMAKQLKSIFWGSLFDNDGNYPHFNSETVKKEIDYLLGKHWRYRHPAQFDSLQEYVAVQILVEKERFLREKGYKQATGKMEFQFKDLLPFFKFFKGSHKRDLRDYITNQLDDDTKKMEKREQEIIISEAEKDVKEHLLVISKKLAVNQAITDMGYTPRDVDPFYLLRFDSNDSAITIPQFQLEIDALAKQMGVTSIRHPLTTEKGAESAATAIRDRLLNDYSSLSEDELFKNYRELRAELVSAFPNLLPQSRRMYYLLGAY